MEIIKTNFEDVFLIKNKVYVDERGFFTENFNQDNFNNLINNKKQKINFVQDNLSFSKKNILRGLHFQLKPFEQGKLISVIKGEILDVIVDIRQDSQTFKKWQSFILSEANKIQLWIPEGLAHGFLALKDSFLFYKTTNYYNKYFEKTIIFNDKNLNIDWQINKEQIILSDKDKNGLKFEQIFNN